MIKKFNNYSKLYSFILLHEFTNYSKLNAFILLHEFTNYSKLNAFILFHCNSYTSVLPVSDRAYKVANLYGFSWEHLSISVVGCLRTFVKFRAMNSNSVAV